jgi:hypothetical protein
MPKKRRAGEIQHAGVAELDVQTERRQAVEQHVMTSSRMKWSSRKNTPTASAATMA